MDLPTHIFFGMLIAAVCISNPQVVILVALGSALPDLDREYWFMKRKKYEEEQFHRSLLHNLLFIYLFYFVNPWISLGIFLHSLLDSFTTVKDRGVEWFWPFSRFVKRGIYGYGCKRDNGECTVFLKEQMPEPKRVYFAQEDPEQLTEFLNVALVEQLTKVYNIALVESRPVPWRRTYGPSLNSQLLDKCTLLSSLLSLGIYILIKPDFRNAMMNYHFSSNMLASILIFSITIVFLYVCGEIDRKIQIRKLSQPFLMVCAICAVPFMIMIFSLYLFIDFTWILSQSFLLIPAIIFLVIALIVWKYGTRGNKHIMV